MGGTIGSIVGLLGSAAITLMSGGTLSPLVLGADTMLGGMTGSLFD
jgi:hypothetical protein